MINNHIDIAQIIDLVKKEKIVWRNHMLVRMQQRGIRIKDVLDCLLSGEIIEEYPVDYPYPSCLILGYTHDNRPLHTVIAVGDDKAWMITAYYPDPDEWQEDLKTRRGN